MSIKMCDCPICMCAIGEVDRMTTECGHTYHTSCMLQNISRNGVNCPLCRTSIVENVKIYGEKDLNKAKHEGYKSGKLLGDELFDRMYMINLNMKENPNRMDYNEMLSLVLKEIKKQIPNVKLNVSELTKLIDENDIQRKYTEIGYESLYEMIFYKYIRDVYIYISLSEDELLRLINKVIYDTNSYMINNYSVTDLKKRLLPIIVKSQKDIKTKKYTRNELLGYSVVDLRNLCKHLGVRNYSGLNKRELIDFLILL